MDLQIQQGKCAMVPQDDYDKLIVGLVDVVTGYITVKEVLGFPDATAESVSASLNMQAERVSALRAILKTVLSQPTVVS